MREPLGRRGVDDFVTASVRRFEALARQDLDPAETEDLLFRLVDEVRREADDRRRRLGRLARRLENLAHALEVPTRGAPDAADCGAPLRQAGVLRRAADLLCGPEKDLTPPDIRGGDATPGA
jgi:hypothetical protein